MSRSRRYIYQTTNKASIVLLIIVIVALSSLFIDALLPAGYEWVLQRIAWPLWGMAFLIRFFEFMFRQSASRRQP